MDGVCLWVFYYSEVLLIEYRVHGDIFGWMGDVGSGLVWWIWLEVEMCMWDGDEGDEGLTGWYYGMVKG